MSFYCDKHVNKGRKEKECQMCGKTIGIGEPSTSIPSESFECTVVLCDECYNECEVRGITEVDQIPSYEDRQGDIEEE